MPRFRISPDLLKLLSGPVLALIVWLLMPDLPQTPGAAATAAIAVWMGAWWLTEALPLAATSLIPLAAFPLLGVLTSAQVASSYMNDVVFLFVGGFIVALAMERWNLHRRIALKILLTVGGGPGRTLVGFMAATALLSMWISNTASAMMMLPIAAAVLVRYDRMLEAADGHRFATGLMLGIAYSASVGGVATLVGTPPNLVFARLLPQSFPSAPEVSFAQWMAFALPVSLLLFFVVWVTLHLMYARHLGKGGGAKEVFRAELAEMGPMSREEKWVLAVFLTLAVAWITRKPLSFGSISIGGWSLLLPDPSYVGDGTAAITLALLLFILPGREKGERLMDWATARKLPWGIVLLFGGGFALAGAISASGLSVWIGQKLSGLASLSPMMMTGGICTLMTFTTELTSNTATTQMVLPILAALSTAIMRNPLYLMVPATLSASCAFMMPVATPPNAIVFGTGRLTIAQMAKTGLILNLIGVVLITLWLHLAGPALLGGGPLQMPAWSHVSP